MKYFSKKRITHAQIAMLKRLRKVYVYKKIVNYNDNFTEIIQSEKPIKIKPPDDDILQLIKDHLEIWLDGFETVKRALAGEEQIYYEYDKLPSKLKSYIRQCDEIAFNLWYNDVTKGIQVDKINTLIDRIQNTCPDISEEEKELILATNKPIASPITRRARESARRAYQTVTGILKSNVTLFDTFITLTFASEQNSEKHRQHNDKRSPGEIDLKFRYIDPTNFNEAKKAYTSFINSLSKDIKKEGIDFKYLAVWELQKNGNYHFHILSSTIPESEKYLIPEWLDTDHRTKKRYNGMGLKKWKYGKSDCQRIRNHTTISTYVSKYIIKSFYNLSEETYIEYLQQKKFFPSHGLKRPKTTYYDIETLEPEQTIDKKIVPYEKIYINPYNKGKINKKHYTLLS